MKTALLLSQPEDAHIPPVVEAIERLGGRSVYCDLADFPERLQVTAQIHDGSWNGEIQVQGQSLSIPLDTLTSVWWRRPQNYHAPESYAPAVRTLLEHEAYRGFLGLLLGVPGSHHPFWVSNPNHIRAAEFKLVQLTAARSLGLRVPRTLVTNDPVAVSDFYHLCGGRIIIKAVWRGILDPHGPYTPGDSRFLFTSEVTDKHLDHLEGVRATAHLFQERIDKRMELRVVIMGKRLFAVEIFSQHAEASSLDWRRSYKDLRYGVHQLPPTIEEKLFRLVRLFGLQFASMDLILTSEGEYVWLELNPNGQYGWMIPQTGLPMAETMAHLLLYPEEDGLW